MIEKREWKKESSNYYSFWYYGTQLGSIEFINKFLQIETIFCINQSRYKLLCTGNFQQVYYVYFQNEVIIKIDAENAIHSRIQFSYKNQEYFILFHNHLNKGIELIKDNVSILKYSVSANEENCKVSVSSTPDNDEFLFDMILWFFFHGTADKLIINKNNKINDMSHNFNMGRYPVSVK